MSRTQTILNNNEVDIPIGTDEIIEFTVEVDEIVTIQNTHPFESVFFQVSNETERGWLELRPGDYTKIGKTMLFRTSTSSTETVTLVTDRPTTPIKTSLS